MKPFNRHDGGMGGFRIGPGSISPIIKYLVIINGIIFLIQNFSSIHLAGIFGLIPAEIYRDFPNNMYKLYQAFTYMFLHGGFFHVFFNMFVLWMFGTEIENTWGSRPFFKFYIYCGLGGALLSLIFNYGLAGPIVGASGAVYGILAVYWIMFPERYLFGILKVRWGIPLLAVLNFMVAGPNVAHLAHLGGALVGLAYVKLDWRVYGPSRWLKNMKYKRQVAKQEKRRHKAEDVMKKVDGILDKINEVGIENISKEEKQFLQEASNILSKDENKNKG